MFNGVPGDPNHSRFWQVVDKHRVEIFYTARTALPSLMCEGDGSVKATSRQSLGLLGTVGERRNLKTWRWCHEEGARLGEA